MTEMTYHFLGNGFIQTMRTNSASNIDDLIAVTHRIHSLYPKAAIVGMGVSLGG